jgi:hypothetical protein
VSNYKIVALLPFRNEELFLPIYLKQMEGIADLILGYDDGSSDQSATIFRENGGVIVNLDVSTATEGRGATKSIRDNLLDYGRKIGGTHFIVLDADEFFVCKSKEDLRSLILSLKPKQKLLCEWIMLASNARSYRNRHSVWAPRPKDFIFCDSPLLSYPDNSFVHFARTPQFPNETYNDHEFHSDFAVIHIQFVNWSLGQVKQCWYRLQETLVLGKDFRMVNEKYSFSKEKEETYNVSPLKDVFLSQIKNLDFTPILNADVSLSWYYKEVENFVYTSPRRKIQDLDIWFLQETIMFFLTRFGTKPKKLLFYSFLNLWHGRINYLLFIGKRTAQTLLLQKDWKL